MVAEPVATPSAAMVGAQVWRVNPSATESPSRTPVGSAASASPTQVFAHSSSRAERRVNQKVFFSRWPGRRPAKMDSARLGLDVYASQCRLAAARAGRYSRRGSGRSPCPTYASTFASTQPSTHDRVNLVKPRTSRYRLKLTE